MGRDYLHNLLERYQSGQCSDEERKIVEAWYDSLGEKNGLSEISEQELESVKERVWALVNIKPSESLKIERKVSPQAEVVQLWPRLLAAVAVVGIVICATLFFNVYNRPSGFTQEKRVAAIDSPITIENHTDSLMILNLEDGSLVSLAVGSKIIFPEEFGQDKREVFIWGEAFFEVSKNADSPFYVYASNLITKVVGTSFFVRSGSSQMSEVEVVTGKVIVTANEQGLFSSKNEVYITPNQKVVFDADSKKLIPTIVDNPNPLESAKAMIEYGFVYKNVQLLQVLKDIELTYGINIIPEDTRIYNCTFTGDLNDENMFSKLELICQSTGMTYEVHHTNILIKGKACNP
ncbi:FecR domain-containing protein [Belliella sp. DSM 111904]|uniref:FecR domain-containing protein n=1 Tax=Belliella filtrata TaxID=2923435 RepID=A0ABS9V4R0_9BACT|nr:FecR family protein [Belliella filtrata]MCH7411392.1 FecR domain-containing protein [Belliella filtrata]